LSELRVLCQEILTNFGLLSQETLTKKRALQACLVKKPLQKPFYREKPSISQGLPVEKKIILTAVCISALLFSTVAGTQLLNLGRANPYKWLGAVPPRADTKPPAITFSSENNTVYPSNNLIISFNVKLLRSPLASDPRIYTVYYNTSWQNTSVVVYQWSDDDPYLTEFSNKLNLTSIPEGNQNITIRAIEYGIYWGNTFYYTTFNITGSSSISFTIDTTPPTISVLSIENATYGTTDVDLSFSVSEPVSQITYSLDGQENVTIAGNTTLSDLSVGTHNVTVYAWDTAGNVRASETITFTVTPFPAVPVAVASVASIAVVIAGLLVYFKKRKK
jgi:hypothetical protein